MSEEEKAIKRLEEIKNNYSLNGKDLHYANILYYLIINLQQENQQLKDVNSLSKRELYKINRDRLDANLKLLKENEKLKLRIDTNTSILAIMNSKLEEENKELKEKLKMKEILCFNMPKGVDIICLTKADYEKNKSDYETIDKYKKIISKATHFINCNATDFDDGRWNLELSEIQLLELQSILRGEK